MIKKSKKNKKNFLEQILLKGRKPVFGNSRSFSNIASGRIFKLNKQKVSFNSKTFRLPVRELKILTKSRKNLNKKKDKSKKNEENISSKLIT